MICKQNQSQTTISKYMKSIYSGHLSIYFGCLRHTFQTCRSRKTILSQFLCQKLFWCFDVLYPHHPYPTNTRETPLRGTTALQNLLLDLSYFTKSAMTPWTKITHVLQEKINNCHTCNYRNITHNCF